VQDYIQQRAVNFQVAVVADESQLAKLVHEKADSGASDADQLRQRLLTHHRNYCLGHAFLAEICKQEKDPRQPFLARVEEVVHQILLNSNVAGEQIAKEHPGKSRLIVKDADRIRFVEPHD